MDALLGIRPLCLETKFMYGTHKATLKQELDVKVLTKDMMHSSERRLQALESYIQMGPSPEKQ